MKQMNTLANIQLVKCADGAVAGTTDIEGSVVDMQGQMSATFIAQLAVANAGNKLIVQGGNLANLSDAVTLEGAEAVCGTGGKLLAVEVFGAGAYRYLRGVLKRAASSASGTMLAALTGSRVLPVDNSAIEAVTVVAPEAVSE